MIRQLQITTLPLQAMRYRTVGDWLPEVCGVRQIFIAAMPDDYALMVAFHEMMEAHLCQKHGVPAHLVDAWDLTHLDSDDPGALEGCPYFAEHHAATTVERSAARVLNVNWARYDACLTKLMDGEGI